MNFKIGSSFFEKIVIKHKDSIIYFIQTYDETHIIGLGYDTKEDGTRITTSSQLTYNHKALLFSKEKNIIAFPLNSYENRKTNSRAAIYEIDLEKGFTLDMETACTVKRKK